MENRVSLMVSSVSLIPFLACPCSELSFVTCQMGNPLSSGFSFKANTEPVHMTICWGPC